MMKVCTVEGCDRKVKARQRCGTHYDHLRMDEGATCTYEGCDRPASGRMCSTHAWRKRHGKPMDNPVQGRRAPSVIASRTEDGLKQCAQCLTYLPVADFGPAARLVDGLNYACRECLRSNSRLRVYGMSPEKLSEMMEDQEHRCAVCGEPLTEFHIDHDHRCCAGANSCGKCVRGLLCPRCNRGLGHFGDDPNKLIAAAEYVKLNLQKEAKTK